MKKIVFLIFVSILIIGCSSDNGYKVLHKIGEKSADFSVQFSLMPVVETGVDFQNQVEETESVNFMNFANIYNGGGVATADFNNDGLVDLYFTSNQQSNKLYLNQGDFEFKDITKSAGVEDLGGWTTGVSVVDINNDGWFDLYVCKSGVINDNTSRINKLYVNQKDNTFIESAKIWGVDDDGYSTQSYFFDYDKDGDLDMYLLNHRPDFTKTTSIDLKNDSYFSKLSSDKLYRNDGTIFKEITHQAGIVNKAWGLSASIGDFNNDNWPDVYVCNDFLSPDMLYINNKNGTFKNEILTAMNHVSFSSMGSDYADINNDLLPDLLVLEMAAEDHIRSKRNMSTMSTASFKSMVKAGYHNQYMINTLQLNRGNGMFSEVSQLSGLAKTDWSWAPLIADFDNDGYKDVFITNGILKDMGDQDFRISMKEKFSESVKPTFEDITSLLPSTKLANYGFKNKGDYTFENVSESWGLNEKSHSNGVAYADLDNDGDLDLVINNINDGAQLYRNNDSNNFIQIQLKGDLNNKFAIGSKITIKTGDKNQVQELNLSRGFLSSVQNIFHFGVGQDAKVDELLIEWPNSEITRLKDVPVNQIITINQEESVKLEVEILEKKPPLLTKIDPIKKAITYRHRESKNDDFKNQVLLPHSQSTNGPFMAKADVNNDGLEDFFIGGAAGQPGELYLQTSNGNFRNQESKVWRNDRDYEDLGVLFFDADNDMDQDLYIVSGSSEFVVGSELYQDRLYLNDGLGNFSKSSNSLPVINSSGQCVKASDIDGDGDLDLFVGGRIIPDKYPYAPNSYILINENGRFSDKTLEEFSELRNIGMVTDATFSDYDNDGDEDLIVVGEWMAIRLFENHNGKFKLSKNEFFNNTEGLWFNITTKDIDSDGDDDYFVGNLGLNSKFKVDSKKEFHIFCDDFDGNGTYDIVLSGKYKGNLVPSRGRECSSQQMPFVKEKFPSFQSFAEASLVDVYGEENIDSSLHYEAKLLESVFIENLGNGKFKRHKLPNSVQLSPVMGVDFVDVNNDGKEEILIVGNHYNTEVETVRYDASYGAVLEFDNGSFRELDMNISGFTNSGNAKDISVIDGPNEKIILTSMNNDRLQMFTLKK